MAFENLFVRTKKSIGGTQLDAVIIEDHVNSVRLTKNPVELGADIVDHAIVEPKRITIVAEVSDTPLGTAALGQIVDTVTGLFGTSNTSNITRSNAAYNQMVALQEKREPIEVQTKLKLYTDMVIVGLRTTQDKDSSRIASMVIDLEEVIIVETQVVQLSAEALQAGSARDRGTPADNKGRQEATTPGSSTNKSVLKSVVDFFQGE